MSSSDKQSYGKPSKAPSKVPKSGIAKTKKSKLAIEKALMRDIIEKSIKQGEMAEIKTKMDINARKGESAEVKNKSKDEPMEVEIGESSKDRNVEEDNVNEGGRAEDVVEVRNEGFETNEVIIEGVIVDTHESGEEEVFQKEEVKVEKKYEEKDLSVSTSSVDASMIAESTNSAYSWEGVQLSLEKTSERFVDLIKRCKKVMEAMDKAEGKLAKEFKNIQNEVLKDQVKEYPEGYEKSEHKLQMVKKVAGEAKEDEKDMKEGGEKLKGDEEKPKV